jgi:hypothetical protein
MALLYPKGVERMMNSFATDELRTVRATSAVTWRSTHSTATAFTYAAAFYAPRANYGKKHGGGGTWRSIG